MKNKLISKILSTILILSLILSVFVPMGNIIGAAETVGSTPDYSSPFNNISLLKGDSWAASYSSDPQGGVSFSEITDYSFYYEDYGKNIVTRTKKAGYYKSTNDSAGNPFSNMAALTYTAQKFKYFTFVIDYKFDSKDSSWPVFTFNQQNTTPEMFYRVSSGVANPTYSDEPIGIHVEYGGEINISSKKIEKTRKAISAQLTGTDWHKLKISVTPGKVYIAVLNMDGTVANELTKDLPSDYKGGYISIMQNGISKLKAVSITKHDYFGDYTSAFNNISLLKGDSWAASYSSDPQGGVSFSEITDYSFYYEDYGKNIVTRTKKAGYYKSTNDSAGNPFSNMAALTYTAQKFKYFTFVIDYKFDSKDSSWPVFTFNQQNTTPEMFYRVSSGVANPTYSDEPIGIHVEYGGEINISSKKIEKTRKAISAQLTGTDWHKLKISVTPGKVYIAVLNMDGTVANELTKDLPSDYKGGYISIMQNGISKLKAVSILDLPEISINNYYGTPDGNGGIANDNIFIERYYSENIDYVDILPEKSGYSFMGFYRDAEYQNKIELNSSIDRNATIYTKWSEFADINADGNVDVRDLVKIKEIASKEENVLAADLDFDGEGAKGSDLTVLIKKFLKVNVQANASSAAELMNDGILYPLGRTMVYDGAVEMDYVNTGFVFKGNFEGDVKADFAAHRIGSLLNVSVDGGENKVIELSLDGLTTLAEDLPKGEHTIEVISGTSTRYTPDEATDGYEQFNGTLRLNKLYYTGTPLTYISDKSTKVLFLGDEITCGYGLDKSVENGYKASNSYYSYASVLGRRLNAEVEVVARCGAKTCYFAWNDCGANNQMGRHKGHCNGVNWLSSLNPRENIAYDYANNQPDIIVINLGSNDIPYGEGDGFDDTSDKYNQDVTSLLDRVHTYYPNSKIIWTLGMMDKKTNLSNEYRGYFKNYVETWSQANGNIAYFLDLSEVANRDGYSERPTIQAHSDAAAEIYSFILENDIGINVSNLAEIDSVQKKNNAVTLSINTLENTTEELEITFPKSGGVRLNSVNKGLYNCEENYNITCQTAGDITTITAENGDCVKLNQKTDDWSIDLYDSSNQKVTSLSGSQIVFFYNDDIELVKTQITGDVNDQEKFTGLGERFNGLVQNGGVVTLWNKDCYADNFDDNSSKTSSYINIPLLNSTNGYSIFLNSTYKTVADIAATDKTKYTLTTNGDIFDIYCFVGETSENLEHYTNLTGKSALPPKWAFSYMAGNHSKVWNKNGDPVAYLQYVMEEYSKLGTIPSAVYGEYGPEYNQESYDILAQYGSRMIGWQDSGMYFGSIDKYMNGIDGEYPLIKSLNGNKTYMSGGSSGDAYIDFTNPLGKLLFKNRILERVNLGWKGGMIDFGDDVLLNSISYNGLSGDQMHNLYPYYYTKNVSEVLSETIGNDYFAFSRSGTAGTQKYMSVFTGDHPSTFQGLKQSLYGGLSLSSSGFSIWGSDLGGHGKQSDKNDADLYRRWLQLSTFSPLMRAHGLTDRNPWSYEEGFLIFKTNMNDEFKKYYWIRENFVDAIYSSAVKSSIFGSAMTQPLMNAFPNQSALYSVEDEYMFCDELLVAPVTEANAISRNVTLPSGKWVNFWTGETVEGGTTISVSADKSTIPLFLRSGALMPVRLNSDFSFGTALNDSEIVNALMITAAEETRNVTVYLSETESKNYTISKNLGSATVINAENGSNIRMFVLKGIKASSVTVDGNAINSTATNPTAQNSGFKVKGNDTYVYLPEGEWNEIAVF